MTITWETQKPTYWPNTSIDNRAWELAKAALGPDANIHALVERAQRIKQSLKEI